MVLRRLGASQGARRLVDYASITPREQLRPIFEEFQEKSKSHAPPKALVGNSEFEDNCRCAWVQSATQGAQGEEGAFRDNFSISKLNFSQAWAVAQGSCLFGRTSRPFPRRHLPEASADFLHCYFTHGRSNAAVSLKKVLARFQHLSCFYRATNGLDDQFDCKLHIILLLEWLGMTISLQFYAAFHGMGGLKWLVYPIGL